MSTDKHPLTKALDDLDGAMTRQEQDRGPDTERSEGLERQLVRARKALAFLHGKAGWDTIWFSGEHPSYDGKFWWRREILPVLAVALDALQAQVERLTQERDAAKGRQRELSMLLHKHAERAETAERALEEARVDSERLLRRVAEEAYRGGRGEMGYRGNDPVPVEQIEGAIDAARLAAEGGRG